MTCASPALFWCHVERVRVGQSGLADVVLNRRLSLHSNRLMAKHRDEALELGVGQPLELPGLFPALVADQRSGLIRLKSSQRFREMADGAAAVLFRTSRGVLNALVAWPMPTLVTRSAGV